MTELTWTQVQAWRVQQHHLDQRAKAADLVKVVKELGGVQAQVLSAAELALWNRVGGLRRHAVDEALWKEKTLVKTWSMRGTLHLMPAGEFPMWCSAASTKQLHWQPAWLRYHGVTATDLEAIIQAVPEALDGHRLTREQLADAVVRITRRPRLADPLRVGWGALLKPSAFKGHLCFGPNEGQNVTFVRPDQWLGKWKAVESEKALAEVARRYLRAYGPAKRDELAGWWGVRGPQARPMLASLGHEVEEVSVEGWRGWIADDVARAARRWPEGSVRLLGHFDPLILLSAKYPGYTLKTPHKLQIYRKAGWVSPVLLVDGVIRGVWALDKPGGAVQLIPFAPLTPQIRRQLIDEMTALKTYLRRGLDLRIVRSLTPAAEATP